MQAWLKSAASFLVAWTVVCLFLAAVDWATSWRVEPYAIAWLCIGIGLTLQLKRLSSWPDAFTPADALQFLWQCALWPLRFIK